MQTFLIQRLITAVITVFVVSIVVFLFVQASGNAATMLISADVDSSAIPMLEEKLGLNDPLYIQYIRFMYDFLTVGDAVTSFVYYTPVLPMVLEALKWTMVLALGAITISISVAIPLGTLAAIKRGSFVDLIIRLVAVFGQSMPSFWVAMMLMLIVAVKLQWVPVSGTGVKEAILPMTVLSFYQLAVLLRLFRAEMLEVIHQDYVRTARAKGLKEWTVIFRHCMQNAALPVLTMAGIQLSQMMLGAIVIEPIFAWPGIGYLIVGGVMYRDYPIVVGGVMVAGFLVTSINLMVDLLYGRLDPRIRVS